MAYCEDGIHRTRDGGAHWERLDVHVEPPPVHSMAASDAEEALRVRCDDAGCTSYARWLPPIRVLGWTGPARRSAEPLAR